MPTRTAMSRLGLALEMPTLAGRVHTARFVLGASIHLHRHGFGGGYGQFVALF